MSYKFNILVVSALFFFLAADLRLQLLSIKKSRAFICDSYLGTENRSMVQRKDPPSSKSDSDWQSAARSGNWILFCVMFDSSTVRTARLIAPFAP